MDFLKAFEQAQTLGLTKEEFINVWESESKLKMVASAVEMNSSSTGYGDMTQAYQIKEIDGHGSSVDGVVNKLATMPEAKRNNNIVPDNMYRHLIDKYEQLCQQMYLKYDQLLQEFHSHFEVLSNHINNVQEAQTNSLKLYFMQEIDLMKQDLKRFIEEQNERPETGKKQAVISAQKLGMGHLQNSSVNQDVASQSQSSSSYQISSNIKDQRNNNPKYDSFQQKTEGFKMQGGLAQPDFDFYLTGDRVLVDNTSSRQQALSRPENSFADILKAAPVKSQMNTGGMAASVKNAPTNYASAAGLQKPSATEAGLNLNKGSVAATGLVAHAIASQMKLKQTSQAGSVKSSTNSVKSEPVTTKPAKKKVKPYISKTSSAVNSKFEFTMEIVSSFIDSNKPFVSPYVYSNGKPCKARLVLHTIDKSLLLTVHIHVSKGEFDDSHKWPLHLKGSGYVFHPGSQRFSPLWQLEPVICEKPGRDKERVFPAAVCLMTAKRNMKDVTMQDLLMRYKVGEDSLTFLWDLKATEKQKKAEG